MSTDDREERARVYARIAPLIMDFHMLFAGEMFHVEQLRQSCAANYPTLRLTVPARSASSAAGKIAQLCNR